jgi:hypothetical protein
MAVLLAFASDPSWSGEAAYCLSWTGPDQTYLCRVTGENVRQNEVSKLYCVVRTTKKGHHASCAATESAENCHGVLKTYKYKGPALPSGLTENSRVKRFIDKMERQYANAPKVTTPTQADVSAIPPAPSRFQRIRHAAGKALQSTFRCMRSLFRDCGGRAQD